MEYKYKGYRKIVTTDVSENGEVINMSIDTLVNWEEMNIDENTQQQQQQQSSREDGPGIA